MSNPEFPRPYASDPRRDGHSGSGNGGGWQNRASGGDRADGSASGYGRRGRGSDGGYGDAGYRDSGGRGAGRRAGSGRGYSGRRRAGDGGNGDAGYGDAGYGGGPGSGRRAAPGRGGSGRRGRDSGGSDGGRGRGNDGGYPGSDYGRSETSATGWRRWKRGGGRGTRRGGTDSDRDYRGGPQGQGSRRWQDGADPQGRPWPGRGQGSGDPRDPWSGGTSVRDRYRARMGMPPGDGYPPGAGYPGGPPARGATERLPFGRAGGGGGNGGGGRFLFSADWWRHWTWRKALTVAASCFGGTMMMSALAVGIVFGKTPIPNPQAAALQQSSIVYFGDGKTQVGQFGSTDRQRLTINQIPPMVREAVVAAEDKNFYHEGGISPTGIIRAAYYDLISSGGGLQGGSTITQQLVRNFYNDVGTAQTLSRKVKEIFIAQKLAQVKSKAWILEQYLNTVYFGNHAYGIGAASQAYFGVPVTKLSPAQAAMLAAMIQQPGKFSPDPKAGAGYQGLVYRWHYVLSAMVKAGWLSQEVASKQKFPKVVNSVNNSWGGYRGYIMQAVQYELLNTYHYTQEQIDNGGLRVTTTFSKHLMDALYKTVSQNERLMRHGTPPVVGGITGATVASTGLPRWVDLGAMLEQPGTGAILAMYSGKDYNKRKYDFALQSRNQVGSSFKPYVLATAVQQGMNVQKSTLNGYAPLWIPPDSQPLVRARLTRPASYRDGWYKVTNDEIVNSQGPVSVVKATAESLNTAYTDLWHRVALNTQTGAHNVIDMAKAFGVDTQSNASGLVRMRDEAGTALGQASLTVEEQATFIATLAAGGEYSTPHVIKQVQAGNTIIKAKILHRQVLTSQQAADVDYAMSFDFSPYGTAPGMGLTNGQTVIAKTGTTNLSQQAFFMAATQRDAFAIGMFVEKPGCHLAVSQQYLCTSQRALAYTPPPGLQTLFGVGGLAGYGGQWPALIWHSYFMKEFNSLPPIAWPRPNSYGAAWNLVGQKPKPKPKPKPTVLPPGCRGHGHKVLCPTPTPTPTPTMSASPTPTVTCSTGPGPTQCSTVTPTPAAGTTTTLDYAAVPLVYESRSWAWWLGSG